MSLSKRLLSFLIFVGAFSCISSIISCKSRSFNTSMTKGSVQLLKYQQENPNPFENFAPKLTGVQVAASYQKSRSGSPNAYSDEVYKPFIAAVSRWIAVERDLKVLSADELKLSQVALGEVVKDWKILQNWLPKNFEDPAQKINFDWTQLAESCPLKSHQFCDTVAAAARAPKTGATFQAQFFAKRLNLGENRWSALEQGIVELGAGVASSKFFPELVDVLAFCGEAKRVLQVHLTSCMNAPIFVKRDVLLPGVSAELAKLQTKAEKLLTVKRVTKSQIYFLLRDLTCLNTLGATLSAISEQDFDFAGARLSSNAICKASKAFQRTENFLAKQINPSEERRVKNRAEQTFDLAWPILGVAAELLFLSQNPASSEFVPVAANSQFGYKDFNDLTPFPLFLLGVDLEMQTEFDFNKGDSAGFFVHDAAHVLTAFQSSHADLTSLVFNSMLNISSISDSYRKINQAEPIWKKMEVVAAGAAELLVRNSKSLFLEESRTKELIVTRLRFYNSFWGAFQKLNPSLQEQEQAHELWFDINHEGIAESLFEKESMFEKRVDALRSGNYWQSFVWRSLNSQGSFYQRYDTTFKKMLDAFLSVEPSFSR